MNVKRLKPPAATGGPAAETKEITPLPPTNDPKTAMMEGLSKGRQKWKKNEEKIKRNVKKTMMVL